MPLDSEKFAKNREKEGENQEKSGKEGKNYEKEEKSEGSFTLPLLTDRTIACMRLARYRAQCYFLHIAEYGHKLYKYSHYQPKRL